MDITIFFPFISHHVFLISMLTPQLFISTPLVYSRQYSSKYDRNVFLKLEYLQPSGSFKSRGLGAVVKHHHDALVKSSSSNGLHFYSSSGGNAGLAAAVAATSMGYPAHVVVPSTTKQRMIDLIRATGAEVEVHGNIWAEADAYMREKYLTKENAIYCHPFDDPLLWPSYARIITEIESQLPEYFSTDSGNSDSNDGKLVQPDAIVCSVGGGGLYAGLAMGLLASRFKGTRLVTVETVGASKLAQSLEQGRKVRLENPKTIATSLAACEVCDQVYTYATKYPETIPVAITVEDEEAVSACREYLQVHGVVVEPACGAALAALEKLDKDKYKNVIVIVCGGSSFSAENLC